MGIYINPDDYAPNWSPNWDDVVFDHQACATLVQALRDTATALGTATSQRITRATEQSAFVGPVPAGQVQGGRGILNSWTGTHRTTWETDYNKLRTDATTYGQKIEGLITTLTNASTAATTEQNTRVAKRAQWQKEYDAGMAQMKADVADMRKRGMPVTVA